MKTVVITGSTRGLGFEMAREFCTNGANVVINGVNEKRLEDSVAKLRELSGTRESGGAVAELCMVPAFVPVVVPVRIRKTTKTGNRESKMTDITCSRICSKSNKTCNR